MSDKTARTYTHPTSNRAKPRENGDRKVVFKSVLDNPFRIQWPSVPINVQNSVLAHIISVLGGVSEYRFSQDKANRKRKRGRGDESTGDPTKSKRRRKGNAVTTEEKMEVDPPRDSQDGDAQIFSDSVVPSTAPDAATTLEKPTILQHLTIGINEVTKRLEAQVDAVRRKLTVPCADASVSSQSQPAIKVIFVCRADIDPPILIDHLPHLVAAFNSSRVDEPIKIVPLPKGAEFTLAKAVGLRRVAVMAMDSDAPELSGITPLLGSVPTLTAAWLSVPAAVGQDHRFVPTHIKQVRTSAPKDMNEAKERRAKEKGAAKNRRKLGSNVPKSANEKA